MILLPINRDSCKYSLPNCFKKKNWMSDEKTSVRHKWYCCLYKSCSFLFRKLVYDKEWNHETYGNPKILFKLHSVKSLLKKIHCLQENRHKPLRENSEIVFKFKNTWTYRIHFGADTAQKRRLKFWKTFKCLDLIRSYILSCLNDLSD